MFRRFCLVILLVLSALLGAGWVAPVQAATYSITITSTQFIPSTLSAEVGDTITFINTSTATQSAKSTVASGFNSGDIGPGMSKSVTLVNEGTFTFTSQYNSALTGVVTVGAGSSLTSDTTSTAAARTVSTTSTQEQPVSGTAETFGLLLAGGMVFLGAGWYARQQSRRYTLPLVDLPLVSSKHGNDPASPKH